MTRPATSARWRVPALVGVVLVVLSACGVGDGPAGQPLLGAAVLAGGTAIEVEFSGCDSSPDVDVRETASTVRITVAGPNGGCEPGHELTVDLDAPLGDRRLVDGATGEELTTRS